MLDNLTTTKNGLFVPDKAAADLVMVEAISLLSKNRLIESEHAMLDALRLHPGGLYLYRKLAEVYDARGDSINAKRTRLGILSSETEKLITHSGNENPPVCSVGATKRRICFPAGKVSLQPPIVCDDVSSNKAFEQSVISNDEPFVDECKNGSLWFDGFNRILFNSDKNPVAGNKRGSDILIRDITRDKKPAKIDGRVFLVGNRGFNNYYHWMLDILPSFDLFKIAGYSINPMDKIAVFNGSTKFQIETLEQAGIAKSQIIELNRLSPYIEADTIVCPFFSNAMGMQMGEWVPAAVREIYRNVLEDTNPDLAGHVPLAEKIYLARSDNARNARNIGNETELISYLKKREFLVVYAENYSVAQQVKLFSNARVVIGAHGAGFANMVFCKPKTILIEFYGQHLAPCYWAISNILQLRYANLYCASSNDDCTDDDLATRRAQGFDVKIEDVEKILSATQSS